MRRLSRLVLAGALLTGGCGGGSGGTAPTPQTPLRITVQALSFVVDGNLVATFLARLENIGTGAVDLTFPSSCQILPHFENPGGQTVTPIGGGLACATVVTSQRLGPGQSISQPFSVRAAGSSADPSSLVLPAGDYRFVARLDDTVYRVSSDPLAFTVR